MLHITKGLNELSDHVDLHASTAGSATSSSALGLSGADPSAFALPAPAPSTSSSVLASLGDSLLGETGFSVAQSRGASAVAVLRTSTVYQASDGVHDRERVIVAVQLRDGEGNTKVLTSGLAVTLVVTGASALSTSCGGVDAPEGRLTCKHSLPTSWFSSAAGSATAAVEGAEGVEEEGALVRRCTILRTLGRRRSHR